MSKKRLMLIFGLLVISAGGFWIFRRVSSKSDKETQVPIKVRQGTIEDTVEATGEVAPLNRVEIKPPIQGRIEKILVEEGDNVRAGQTLALMSSNDRAAILDAARAKGPAEYNKWLDTYKPTPIVAPLSGVIILRGIVVGQTVDMSTVLFALSDRLIVLGHVDEVDIGRVKIGMPARITLDSYPQNPIDGKVESILYEGKNVSNVITYGVKITPFNVPPFFRSQMTANVSLILVQKKDAVIVPRSVVRDGPGGEKLVMVPGPDGKPVKKDVETGLESGESVEITSGLAPGDTVLLAKKRYVPQRNASQSPLIMGGPRQQQQQRGGGERPQQRS